MFSVRVKEALQTVLYLGRHAIMSMVEPVLSGIFGKGKAVGDLSDVNIQLE
jgi:hypothetical protein